MPPFIDISGKRFGRWVVLRRVPSQNARTVWECRCRCGTVAVVGSKELRNRQSRSCGCLKRDIVAKRNTIHGNSKRSGYSREYRAWQAAKTRCYNSHSAHYQNYGGRGIVMCDRWLHSFANFLSDMGRCPPGYSIDRIDNDGPYSPDNCRWTNYVEQRRNQRPHKRPTNTHLVTYQGSIHSVSEWARLLKIPVATLFGRLRRGWTVESVLRNGPLPKRVSRATLSVYRQRVGV